MGFEGKFLRPSLHNGRDLFGRQCLIIDAHIIQHPLPMPTGRTVTVRTDEHIRGIRGQGNVHALFHIQDSVHVNLLVVSGTVNIKGGSDMSPFVGGNGRR